MFSSIAGKRTVDAGSFGDTKIIDVMIQTRYCFKCGEYETKELVRGKFDEFVWRE